MPAKTIKELLRGCFWDSSTFHAAGKHVSSFSKHILLPSIEVDYYYYFITHVIY